MRKNLAKRLEKLANSWYFLVNGNYDLNVKIKQRH